MRNLVILFYFAIFIANTCCALEIITKQGTVRGRVWISQSGRKFLGFTGIPYAKPPIGKLRFQAAVSAEPWDYILDATQSHNPCPQVDYFAKNFTIIGNEDCLYLNIYKPQTGSNYPVMFYIHGGSFNIGSGADNWISPEILLDKDVVLVIVNYRLGFLGFLSTEDVEQPGNNGLKDQALALHWVKSNIEYFGGNASSITVFGNSAGGMSAHLLTMSPLTKDLISKAVIQSGTATTTFPLMKKGVAKANAEKLGKLCNCSSNSTRGLINCLQEVDVLDIIKNEAVVNSNSDLVLSPFQPIIEIKHPDAFISEDPIKIVTSRKFSNIPLLIGIVEQEGAYRSAEISTQPGQLQKLNDDFATFVSNSFPINEPVLETSKAIRQFYFGNKTIDNSTKSEITDLFSDAWYLSSLDLTLYLLHEYKFNDQPIFLYLFGYRGSTSYSKLYGDLSFDYGVCHTDELLYLVPRHYIFPNYQPTVDDVNMGNTLKNFWFNFAKTGNPSPDSKIWQALIDDKLQHLHIEGPNNLRMKEGLFLSRRKFWREKIYQDAWKNISGRNLV